MHIADITMFYAPASGGVRTYLDAKHHRLDAIQGVRHSLLIPGASAQHADGIYQVPAPPLPFGNGYRFPVRLAASLRLRLHVVPAKAGTQVYTHTPKAAFHHERQGIVW